jgi:predicted MFS family arabinose efflux permease
MLLGGALATLAARWTKIWVQGNITAALVSLGLLLLAIFIRPENIWLTIFLWGICLAASEFVYVTLAMMHAEPRLGAASYAIFMAISNAGIGVGQSITNSLIDTIDEPTIFVGLAVLNLAIFPILARMRQGANADPALAQPSVASGS